MEVTQLGPGLWRWTAPHPEWKPEKGKPGGWGQFVGSVYYEPPRGDAVILFDPLVPPAGSDDADRFWGALDADLERLGRPLAILLGNRFHVRSSQLVLERYRERHGASILVHQDARDQVACEVTQTFLAGDSLPGAVEAHLLRGLEDPEVVFHLRPARALVLADALIGAGGGKVRVPPESWASQTAEGLARYRNEYRDSLRPLLELEPEMMLVSHGDVVTAGGTAALAEALEAPPWGEGP